MVSSARFGLGLLVVAMLVGVGAAAVAGPVAADDPAEGPAANVTEAVSPSLDELRDGGTPLPDAPPGMRADGERMWWVEHWPSDAVLANPGTHDDPGAERVSSTTTVDRTAVYLRTVSLEESMQSETIMVATWRQGTEEVLDEEGNVVDREEVAEDVRVHEHQIEFGAGMPIREIPLGTADEPRQVTMWIEGSEGPRWTFGHDPVATSEPIAVDSVGDFWALAALYLVIPILGGIVSGGTVGKRAIKRAGKGPGYPIVGWLVGIAFAVGGLMVFAFSDVAELIGALPWAAAAFVSLVSLIVIIESQAVRERTVEFLRPEVRSLGGPDGSEAVEILDIERQSETVVDLPGGDPAVVRDGIRPFLSRAVGASARLPSLAFDARIDVSDEDSDVDELILVDPDADAVLDFRAEGWKISAPSERDEQIRLAGIGVVAMLAAVGVGMSVGWLWAVLGGAVVATALLASPVDGAAEVEPASAHVRSAWISAMTLEQDVEDAKTLESARKKIVEQQARGERQTQEALETQDATLINEMLSVDVDRSVDAVDDVDDELLRERGNGDADDDEEDDDDE